MFYVYLQTNETRQILHFNYVTWPDFGVPSSPTAFLKFLTAVRESGALDPDTGPAVIHCSAGIGRSGTFCLVDSALVVVSAVLICIFIYLGISLTGVQIYVSFQSKRSWMFLHPK